MEYAVPHVDQNENLTPEMIFAHLFPSCSFDELSHAWWGRCREVINKINGFGYVDQEILYAITNGRSLTRRLDFILYPSQHFFNQNRLYSPQIPLPHDQSVKRIRDLLSRDAKWLTEYEILGGTLKTMTPLFFNANSLKFISPLNRLFYNEEKGRLMVPTYITGIIKDQNPSGLIYYVHGDNRIGHGGIARGRRNPFPTIGQGFVPGLANG
ncbi:hypothetical protein KC726_00745 [Candidatus Woesebacteria bacterium]|nr:hypothetical protein [Candidatus Woesebacteria bacterium]